MVKYNNKKKGQAAIEFLMTYGWMLLVVLIVGALIFSFVDFGSLLPNKIELSNNLRADPTSSVAYARDSVTAANRDQVKVMFRYNGAKRVVIGPENANIISELSDRCNASMVMNLDTDNNATGVGTTPFLNGQDGIMNFNCTHLSAGLLKGDSFVGKININVKDPKSNLDIPSSGSIRLQVTG